MNKKKNYAKLEERVIELEKRVAALEVPVQAQPVDIEEFAKEVYSLTSKTSHKTS
jgi:uncharacterized coiled-coil protein SlyX